MSLLNTRQKENFIISVDFYIPFGKTLHGKSRRKHLKFQ